MAKEATKKICPKLFFHQVTLGFQSGDGVQIAATRSSASVGHLGPLLHAPPLLPFYFARKEEVGAGKRRHVAVAVKFSIGEACV
jgi:hypothetical protein